jgi:hypothetical protein
VLTVAHRSVFLTRRDRPAALSIMPWSARL